MKYKHIEASREVRLWIKTFAEVAMLGALVWTNEGLRTKVTDKVDAGKKKLKGFVAKL